jgi:hypothetical protein
LSARDFDNLFLQAVDEALSLLGEASKQTIYVLLNKTFGIKKQEIPRRIEDFTEAIEKTFGLGAKFLEILIMKQLYEKVGGALEWQNQDFEFSKYVTAVRVSFQERRKNKMSQEIVEYEEMGIEA